MESIYCPDCKLKFKIDDEILLIRALRNENIELISIHEKCYYREE